MNCFFPSFLDKAKWPNRNLHVIWWENRSTSEPTTCSMQAQYCSWSLTKLPLVAECARIDVALSPGRHWMQQMQTELPWESLQPKQQILLKDPCSRIIAQMRSTWRWLCTDLSCEISIFFAAGFVSAFCEMACTFIAWKQQWHACSALWIQRNVLFLEWCNNYANQPMQLP